MSWFNVSHQMDKHESATFLKSQSFNRIVFSNLFHIFYLSGASLWRVLVCLWRFILMLDWL